jgi:hypothetical protein
MRHRGASANGSLLRELWAQGVASIRRTRQALPPLAALVDSLSLVAVMGYTLGLMGGVPVPLDPAAALLGLGLIASRSVAYRVVFAIVVMAGSSALTLAPLAVLLTFAGTLFLILALAGEARSTDSLPVQWMRFVVPFSVAWLLAERGWVMSEPLLALGVGSSTVLVMLAVLVGRSVMEGMARPEGRNGTVSRTPRVNFAPDSRVGAVG